MSREWSVVKRAVLVLAFSCGAGPSALAQPGDEAHAKLAALVGTGARLAHTGHFTVAYNTPDDVVQGLTARLEATYQGVANFCRINAMPFTPPPEPLEILFFDSLDGFHGYGRTVGFDAKGFNGFYFTGNNRSAFFNVSKHPGLEAVHRQIQELESRVASLSGRGSGTADRDARREAQKQLQYLRNKRELYVERLNRVVIQHEAVHHLLYNVGVHVKGATNPQWFVEGIACIFETPPSSRGSGIGTTNQLRLADFRAACARVTSLERLRPEDLRRAFDSGKFVPLKRLIAEPEIFQNTANANLGNYYAEAWSLAFFLQRTQGKKLAEYVGRLTQRTLGQVISGDEELALFESIFGLLDESFERRWAKFILELQFVPELTE